jgi:vacuolar-type H+-ATPase subunit I/STV1
MLEVEERATLGRMESILLDSKVERLDQKVTGLEDRIRMLDRRVDKLDQRVDKLDERAVKLFQWVIGIQMTTLIAIVAGFFGIVTRLI